MSLSAANFSGSLFQTFLTESFLPPLKIIHGHWSIPWLIFFENLKIWKLTDLICFWYAFDLFDCLFHILTLPGLLTNRKAASVSGWVCRLGRLSCHNWYACSFCLWMFAEHLLLEYFFVHSVRYRWMHHEASRRIRDSKHVARWPAIGEYDEDPV